MRRSGRQPRGGNASTADSLPPHVADGLRAFVRSCPSHVAAMVDASPGVASNTDALTDNLAGVMAVNSLSAESMLARFFTDETIGLHLVAAYGKSGKGNPATLAARLVAQWKPPRKSDTSAADAKKRKNEDDQRGEAATTEGGGGEVDGEVDAALGNRSIDVEVEKNVEIEKVVEVNERDETRSPLPPPKKRSHYNRA